MDDTNQPDQFHISRSAAPVREQVEAALRSAIFSGTFGPGTRLSERKLCSSLGVSRSVLREALRQIETEQLVESNPQRGIFVASPVLADALDIYEVRVELEGLAARLAARFASADAVEELADALRGVEAATATEEVTAVMAAKSLFYQRLVAASGNPVLERSLYLLRNRIQLYRGVALNQPGRTEAALDELWKIQEAIASGEAAKAEAMSRDHIRKAARRLASALARREGRDLSATEDARLDLLGPGPRAGESKNRST